MHIKLILLSLSRALFFDQFKAYQISNANKDAYRNAFLLIK